MTAAKTPRGMRVNNPLNIDRNPANKWHGRLNEGDAAWNRKEKRFEQFESLIYGLRAGAALIIGHFDGRTPTAKRRGPATTLRKLITIWAPPSENKTDAYVSTVARWSGIDPDIDINLQDYAILRPVMEAMVRYEQGGPQPITEAQWRKGLALAGVEAPAQPVAKTPEVKGAATSGISFGGAEGIDQIQDAIATASGPLYDLAPYMTFAKWGLVILGFVSLGYVIYRRWDDIRKLAR